MNAVINRLLILTVSSFLFKELKTAFCFTHVYCACFLESEEAVYYTAKICSIETKTKENKEKLNRKTSPPIKVRFPNHRPGYDCLPTHSFDFFVEQTDEWHQKVLNSYLADQGKYWEEFEQHAPSMSAETHSDQL